MPRYLVSSLLPPFLAYALCVAGLSSLSATAAEEELLLLTIEGDLVGKIETLASGDDSAVIINSYYGLLPEEARSKLRILRRQLASLIPDYEVAYTASDSAELSEVIDEIDLLWATIRTLHAQGFTSEVVSLLNEAYSAVFSFIE